jgi:hypothetical protein
LDDSPNCNWSAGARKIGTNRLRRLVKPFLTRPSVLRNRIPRGKCAFRHTRHKAAHSYATAGLCVVGAKCGCVCYSDYCRHMWTGVLFRDKVFQIGACPMTAESPAIKANKVAKFLAITSALTFWILPFAPLLAIAAVSKTKGTRGWPRTLAVGSSALCILCTLLAASITLWLVCLAILKASWVF